MYHQLVILVISYCLGALVYNFAIIHNKIKYLLNVFIRILFYRRNIYFCIYCEILKKMCVLLFDCYFAVIRYNSNRRIIAKIRSAL